MRVAGHFSLKCYYCLDWEKCVLGIQKDFSIIIIRSFQTFSKNWQRMKMITHYYVFEKREKSY